jgi:hypothetical protein
MSVQVMDMAVSKDALMYKVATTATVLTATD